MVMRRLGEQGHCLDQKDITWCPCPIASTETRAFDFTVQKRNFFFNFPVSVRFKKS